MNGRSMGADAKRSANEKTGKQSVIGISAHRAVGDRARRPAVHGGDFYGGDFYGGDNIDTAQSLKVRGS